MSANNSLIDQPHNNEYIDDKPQVNDEVRDNDDDMVIDCHDTGNEYQENGDKRGHDDAMVINFHDSHLTHD